MILCHDVLSTMVLCYRQWSSPLATHRSPLTAHRSPLTADVVIVVAVVSVVAVVVGGPLLRC
jgi:hypothetical protein